MKLGLDSAISERAVYNIKIMLVGVVCTAPLYFYTLSDCCFSISYYGNILS